MKIFPSMISSNVLKLGETIKTIDPHCNGYHLDIMDDHFVPNLTWGPTFIEAFKQATKKPLDIHLMVDNPKSWVKRLPLETHDSFTFHIEATQSEHEAREIISLVKSKNVQVGIALSPETPVQKIIAFLSELDLVLVMSVNPGFSGQKFIPEVVPKVSELTKLRDEHSYSFVIAMDGGIDPTNIKLLAQTGVDQIGAASAIFNTPDPVQAIAALKRIAQN